MTRLMLKNCPVCGKPAQESHIPFCSARCANIDLGRWLGEKYRVPAEEQGQEPDNPEAEETS